MNHASRAGATAFFNSLLERVFVTAKGRYDFSSLFVEQALNILGSNGVLGLVVPNRVFINKNAQITRTILTEHSELKVIVDFGSAKVFDADAYVGCIIARKLGQTERARSLLRVIKVRSIDSEFLTADLLEAQNADVGE